MPDFAQSLQGRDLGYLRIIAELWGLDWDAPDARVGLARIVPLVLQHELVEDTVHALAGEARHALSDLMQHEGRLPWPLFTRRYGQVREMGAARRDREHPHRRPASPAEALWYRALIGRAFFDTPSGPEEFAYIPEDLLALLPAEKEETAPLGRPATPAERAHPLLADDRILDHACTLLAALRLGNTDIPLPAAELSALRSLLTASGLLEASGMPLPEPVRAFLEVSRGEALAQLARAWLQSTVFNELRLLPSIVCEGQWENEPLRARRAALDFLSTIEPERWWSLPAFIADIRLRHPDFQRPAGDYDSWFIRRANSDQFLRGFEHWDEVDGALIRYLICGPLHWLGITDLAKNTPSTETTNQTAEQYGMPAAVTAFRLSGWAAVLLEGRPPAGLAEEKAMLHARSDGVLRVPFLTPRAARYQLARLGEWLPEQRDAYLYRLTPASLARARQQGLTLNHLLTLLRRYAETIPPSLSKALARWEEKGVEARIETLTVLRLASTELLQAVRASRAARFLGDPLSATTVIVKPGASEKLLTALAELGVLGELIE